MRFPIPQFGPGLFRLMLALAVVLSHLSRFDFGRPAVMIFFMLSGYWVAKMQDGPHHQSYFGYLVSRMLRIWPQLAIAAIFTLTAYTVLRLRVPGSLISTLGLIGLATRRNDLIGTVWSLDIESQFYLILPGLLYCRKFFAAPWRLIMSAFAAFAIGCLLFIEFGAMTVFLYFPVFAAGFAIYLYEAQANRKVAYASLIFGLTAIAVLNVPAIGFMKLDQFQRDIGFMIAALSIIPFASRNVRKESPRSDRVAGDLSYSLYLAHEPCVLIITAMVAGLIGKIIALGTAASVTALLYLCVDRPVNRFRTMLRQYPSTLSHAGKVFT